MTAFELKARAYAKALDWGVPRLRRVAIRNEKISRAILGAIQGYELCTEIARQQLHAVTDAEHRHAKRPDGTGRTWRVAFDNTGGPPERTIPLGAKARMKSSPTFRVSSMTIAGS